MAPRAVNARIVVDEDNGSAVVECRGLDGFYRALVVPLGSALFVIGEDLPAEDQEFVRRLIAARPKK